MNIVKEWTSLTMPELFTIASLERLEGDLHLIFPHVPLTTQQVKGLIFIECIRVDKFLSIKIKRHKRCKRMLLMGQYKTPSKLKLLCVLFFTDMWSFVQAGSKICQSGCYRMRKRGICGYCMLKMIFFGDILQ